jgi:hypothetical protein
MVPIKQTTDAVLVSWIPNDGFVDFFGLSKAAAGWEKVAPSVKVCNPMVCDASSLCPLLHRPFHIKTMLKRSQPVEPHHLRTKRSQLRGGISMRTVFVVLAVLDYASRMDAVFMLLDSETPTLRRLIIVVVVVKVSFLLRLFDDAEANDKDDAQDSGPCLWWLELSKRSGGILIHSTADAELTVKT